MLERDVRTLLAAEKDTPSVFERGAIVQKELGLLLYRMVLANKFPNDSNLYKADLITDGGQLLIQVEMLLYQLGVDPGEARKQMINETLIKYEEFNRKGWGKNVKH
jgi:hypothetical protein